MSNEQFHTGNWVWHKAEKEPVKILEIDNKWGYKSFVVWSESKKQSFPINYDAVDTLTNSVISNNQLIYQTSAARIIEAYSNENILSPVESKVIPLPHQINVLNRVLESKDSIRFLLSDEVGLGKTIEAGLILKELKIRGAVSRILILVPRGLMIQWVQEMKNKFDENFKIIEPQEFSKFDGNIWETFDQIIVSIDSVKPVDIRKGWSKEKIEQYNQNRFYNLISARWDLVIIDESHKLSGTTRYVSRFKLGKGISENTPNLLLLSATPHQGNREQFCRLMSLLDENAFPTPDLITKDKIQPFVVRTEKRAVINDEGDLLFTKRTTTLESVEWSEKHSRQKNLYEHVTDYVLNGYNQAKEENRQYMGFLMILMQRLVSSSTYAITSALERRLSVLNEEEEQKKSDQIEDDWDEKDGQTQLDEIFNKLLHPLINERETVQDLLSLAKKCGLEGPDAKAEFLHGLLLKTQKKENEPSTKFLIFTEFTATQKMLEEFLTRNGYETVILNGSMSMYDREEVQEKFSRDAQIMISTEAGGEGLNLQFCHNVINYDLPWNPMRIEQRIGRVDRIGQKFPVSATNLSLKDTVETRVRQILEEKLHIILIDLGIDKLSDVIDSSDIDADFNKVYVNSVTNPENIKSTVDNFVGTLKSKIDAEIKSKDLIASEKNLGIKDVTKIREHRLPIWTKTMTISYVLENGGSFSKKNIGYDIRWPDGEMMNDISFLKDDAEQNNLNFISLENKKIRNIVNTTANFVSGQKIIQILLEQIPSTIEGLWSLWQVGIKENKSILKIFPMFIHKDGRNLAPTANQVWDTLIENSQFSQQDFNEDYTSCYNKMYEMASNHAKNIFSNLVDLHNNNISRELQKMKSFFEHQKETIQKLGLESVKKHRLDKLELEEIKFQQETQKLKDIHPEFKAISIVYVKGAK